MAFAYQMQIFLYANEFYALLIIGALMIPSSLLITSMYVRSKTEQNRAVTAFRWQVSKIRNLLDEKVMANDE